MNTGNLTAVTPIASLGTQTSLWRRFRRTRFARAVSRNPLSIVGLVIVALLIVMVIVPGLFTSYSPTKLSLASKFMPPSAQHLFGTDQVGIDIFARVIYGARTTAWVVLVVLSIAAGVGIFVGAIAGYAGGWVDDVFMRVTDIFLAFPVLILAIAVNAALGRGLLQTMLAVGFSWWPSYARLVRAQVLAVKNEEYVLAARTLGVSPIATLIRYILWNGIDPIIVTITVDVGFVALTTAGLSFLGLGAEPPTPEWGRMVAEGRDYLLDQWWVSTFPGLALFMVVVGFNLLGEIVRDWLDPGNIGRD